MNKQVRVPEELVPIDEVRAALLEQGHYVGHLGVDQEAAASFVLGVARSLGDLFKPSGCDPTAPVIRTAPTHASGAAPFDRAESIGWHGDFATHEHRPELSLVFVTRPDPRGGNYGAWRLASVAHVIEALRSTFEGEAVFDQLTQEPVPFSYADGDVPQWFSVIAAGGEGRLGLRFYLPSIRRGCHAAYGAVPPRLAGALAALERAADEVGKLVPSREGSLLIVSNWLALHDRVEQTVSEAHDVREALLCFVARPHVAVFQK